MVCNYHIYTDVIDVDLNMNTTSPNEQPLIVIGIPQ